MKLLLKIALTQKEKYHSWKPQAMKYAYNLIYLILTLPAYAFAEDNQSPNSAKHDWSGSYAGVDLGVIWAGSDLNANAPFSFLSDSDHYSKTLTSTTVNPGLHFGHQQQLSNAWVLGGEADFSYPASHARSITTNDTGSAYDRFDVHYNLQGSLRLRAGYALDKFLPFVTAGVSFASMDIHYSNEANNSYGHHTTQTGWVLGTGMEYKVFSHLSARLEYLYTDYGNALKLGVPIADGDQSSQSLVNTSLYVNVLRAGVSYQF